MIHTLANDISGHYAAPLVVRLFHRSRAAILEYRTAGIGAVHCNENRRGFHFQPFPESPFADLLAEIGPGPHPTARRFLLSAWKALQRHADAPAYIALATQSEWRREPLTLTARLIAGIPVVGVHTGHPATDAYRLAGFTANGAPIMAPHFDGFSVYRNSTPEAEAIDQAPGIAGRLHAAIVAETMRQADRHGL